MSRMSLFLVSSALLAGSALGGENWPQWRGPELDGTSDSTGLPTSWSDTENVKWKAALPSWSGSSPIVFGDRVFVMSPSSATDGQVAPTRSSLGVKLAKEGKDLLLFCLARKDGSRLWEHRVSDDNAHEAKHNMSSPSPVADGRHVWVMTGTGKVKCLDVEGRPVWDRDIQKDYGQFGQLWGHGSSPVLVDGLLIIEVLHGKKTKAPSYLLGLDAATGKTVYRVERPTDTPEESQDAYTTPTLLKYSDHAELIVSGGAYITGHDPKTGKEIWRCGGLNPRRETVWRAVGSPVAVDGVAYAVIRNGPMVACRGGGTGDVTGTHTLWTSELAADVPSPVTDGKYLYILHDSGVLSCLDATTGKPYYTRQRVARGTFSASPLLADGRIYATGEDGKTTIVSAGPEFKILGSHQLPGGYTLSSIAVGGKDLFIRTATTLYCIGKTDDE
ncbi:MAG TPA: PQQ-binding-like beta-propeller repeat protein [Phycisphaerae bacterium]|nr:PQQ-binding-like beta-propeller repeat protein [Phycisphaerae bacterium]HRY68463.1 PQQ-binding-like beta-propeller repeat protein [Phycisphaerae bacterium]HSA28501.1 PQQ-binding-like beta-propeller repeat protein [Phycisphaerae bacterium]